MFLIENGTWYLFLLNIHLIYSIFLYYQETLEDQMLTQEKVDYVYIVHGNIVLTWNKLHGTWHAYFGMGMPGGWNIQIPTPTPSLWTWRWLINGSWKHVYSTSECGRSHFTILNNKFAHSWWYLQQKIQSHFKILAKQQYTQAWD